MLPINYSAIRVALGSAADDIIQLLECRNRFTVPVESSTVINVGDICYRDSEGNAHPASDFTWTSDLATSQALFAAEFIGIALEPSVSGQTDPIVIDGGPAVREMTVVSSTYKIGDELGCDESPSETLSSTVLEKVGSAALGVARSMEHKSSATTRLKVSFASAWTNDSSNANASIG